MLNIIRHVLSSIVSIMLVQFVFASLWQIGFLFNKRKNIGYADSFCGIGYRVKKRGRRSITEFFIVMPHFKRKLKAIRCALYYGILPWRWYEEEKHYQCSYIEHLLINLFHAFKWATFNETPWDRRFEKSVNENY